MTNRHTYQLAPRHTKLVIVACHTHMCEHVSAVRCHDARAALIAQLPSPPPFFLDLRMLPEYFIIWQTALFDDRRWVDGEQHNLVSQSLPS